MIKILKNVTFFQLFDTSGTYSIAKCCIWVRISETDHPNWMKIQIYFKMIFYDSVYHF